MTTQRADLPACPSPSCRRCAALKTRVGCGACVQKFNDAIGARARAEIREGETFGAAILRVAAAVSP